ncbi:hypothetical protein [Mesorhizobium sp. 113-3-9]|uniref:hypothetical protein n=1 Tax=Mesorhizobium sp. 113-3-9 TaxID=2744517 RepID=UPI001FD1AB16|nr:hypothetical protein [Mesorhizobium sp. 113-3-9]
MGRALKHAFIMTFLSSALALAGCTTLMPKVEPAPASKHRTKTVRTTTAPKIIRQKKVTAKKLIKPVKNESVPVIAPLGGGSTGGNAGGGSTGGGNSGW